MTEVCARQFVGAYQSRCDASGSAITLLQGGKTHRKHAAAYLGELGEDAGDSRLELLLIPLLQCGETPLDVERQRRLDVIRGPRLSHGVDGGGTAVFSILAHPDRAS